jgi:hypothetical protein
VTDGVFHLQQMILVSLVDQKAGSTHSSQYQRKGGKRYPILELIGIDDAHRLGRLLARENHSSKDLNEQGAGTKAFLGIGILKRYVRDAV